jgi:exodeoxyribonuclease VII small subunit
MSNGLPQTFEQKLARIDEIVKELESSTVELQRATELFKEGKLLARECEGLLKKAQQQIDEATTQPRPREDEGDVGLELLDEPPF